MKKNNDKHIRIKMHTYSKFEFQTKNIVITILVILLFKNSIGTEYPSLAQDRFLKKHIIFV